MFGFFQVSLPNDSSEFCCIKINFFLLKMFEKIVLRVFLDFPMLNIRSGSLVVLIYAQETYNLLYLLDLEVRLLSLMYRLRHLERVKSQLFLLFFFFCLTGFCLGFPMTVSIIVNKRELLY